MNKIVVIDGVEYEPVVKTIGSVVLIRSKNAGIHVGELISKTGSEVVLKNSRRLWYWDGANSISQIALSGVTKPEKCKFSVTVQRIIILGVCEIINCTKEAVLNINEVKTWKA